MRLAIIAILSAFALPILPLPANAAGGCGPGWHPVPPHFTVWGAWVPPHCAPNFPRWP